MTTKSFLAASAFFMAVALGCNTDTPITPEMKLTPVLVESGNISGITFTSSGAFKASDNAIGKIDSCSVSLDEVNGYADTKNNLYIFESGKVPKQFKTLSNAKLYDCLANATWKESGSYTLEHDAEVCQIEFRKKFYFREKGTYPYERAEILGVNVTRYKNTEVIEDYNGFLDFYEYKKDTYSIKEIAQRVGIKSLEEYSFEYVRQGKAYSKIDGDIISNDQNTPIGETDKMYFKNKNGKTTIRLRNVFYDYEKYGFDKYIENKEEQRVLPIFRGGWYDVNTNKDKQEMQSVLHKVISDHEDKIIRGFQCGCGEISSKGYKINATRDDPPPPVM